MPFDPFTLTLFLSVRFHPDPKLIYSTLGGSIKYYICYISEGRVMARPRPGVYCDGPKSVPRRTKFIFNGVSIDMTAGVFTLENMIVADCG